MHSQKWQFLCVCFIALPWFGLVQSANILLSGTYGEGSHFFSIVPIGKSLVERGHNVTVLISDVYAHRATEPEYAELFKFEMFTYPGLKENMNKTFQQMADVVFANSKASQLMKFAGMMDSIQGATCNAVLSDKALMERLKNIDAIVFDMAWPCAIFLKAYLSKQLNVKQMPLILLSASTPIPSVLQMAGSPVNTAYQPVTLTGFTASMPFFERLSNTITERVMSLMVINSLMFKPFKEVADKFELHQVFNEGYQKYIDLYLINSDFAVEFPFPLMPNVIPVGGLTSRPGKPLNKELEYFMQSSGDHGVVVFSLGTYFSSVTAKRPDFVKMFVDAFSRIPQKVMFHLKEAPPFELPPNIKVFPWLPQNDLLSHPKTRVFMYHGGNNGFLEAVHHGVPIVVIPLAGDQYDVAARIEARGIGRQIDKYRLSTDYIYEELSEVLQNPKYSAKAKHVAATFNDRPMKPADRAAFWVEHVMKHGSEYLHSPLHDLTFIQLYLLDVIAFLVLIIGTICYIIYRSVRFCISRCNPQHKAKAKRE